MQFIFQSTSSAPGVGPWPVSSQALALAPAAPGLRPHGLGFARYRTARRFALFPRGPLLSAASESTDIPVEISRPSSLAQLRHGSCTCEY